MLRLFFFFFFSFSIFCFFNRAIHCSLTPTLQHAPMQAAPAQAQTAAAPTAAAAGASTAAAPAPISAAQAQAAMQQQQQQQQQQLSASQLERARAVAAAAAGPASRSLVVDLGGDTVKVGWAGQSRPNRWVDRFAAQQTNRAAAACTAMLRSGRGGGCLPE